jgi:hypothetical protein
MASHDKMRPRAGLLLALVLAVGAAVALPAAAAPTAAQGAPTPTARAGVAVVDASWHVGASQGQYADDGSFIGEHGVDPYVSSTRRAASTGLQSRITVRALVVQGSNGKRTAIVSDDLYLPQDLLNRRVAALIAEHDASAPAAGRTGITDENLTVTASHSHGSPYYSTPSAGVFVFQDVVDLRFYEYMAQRMADAVVRASSSMVPVRMGGATAVSNDITSHSYGPQVADDGTPAGQPWDFTTQRLSVVRFDDISDASRPKPLANWVIFGLHPEWSFGDGLVTGEIMHTIMRMTDRETGAVTVMSQNETGTSGPHKDLRAHAPEARREFQNMKFSAMDRAARFVADTIEHTSADIVSGKPRFPDAYARMTSDFPVDVVTERFAPPATRPYPGVSNCNTDKAFEGNPGVPIAGLPDCEFFLGDTAAPVADLVPLGAIPDQLRAAGVPVPSSYAPPALLALQETAAIKMQAIRLGRIGVTVCPCEQFTDQARNIVSRLDRTAGNLWLGYDWTPACRRRADGSWSCPNPKEPGKLLPPISDLALRRAQAQIRNDAAGWEDDLATFNGESEPPDPAQIKGNFTHEEMTRFAYDLVLTVGMGNDYWGYSPSYREYRQGDHYRKALEAAGPHASDFFATRLSRMAASLNGGPPVPLRPLDEAYAAESARAQAFSEALGASARAYLAVYEPTLPADGGTPRVVAQPPSIRRFDGTSMRFVGGSTYDDLPDARVERLVDGRWTPYGDTRGEVQLLADFPQPEELPDWRAGTFEWNWTATFEAFTSELRNLGDRPRQTPAGTYRYTVSGRHRTGPMTVEPYRLTSAPFSVRPWDGVTVADLKREPEGSTSFSVGPVHRYDFGTKTSYVVGPIDYPDTYRSPFPFIRHDRRLYTYKLTDPARHQQYCPQCSFRPWADTSQVARAIVTVTRTSCAVERVPARVRGDGRLVAATRLQQGDTAEVRPFDVVDTYGERNRTGIGAAVPARCSTAGRGPASASGGSLPTTGGLPAAAAALALGAALALRRYAGRPRA